MKEEVLIFGAGGHSRVITDIIEKQGKYKIAGYIDKKLQVGQEVFSYKVLSNESNLKEILNNYKYGIIAIGDNFKRYLLYKKIKELKSDFQFITAIHPEAVLGRSVEIAEGSVVMAGVVINPNSKIGKFCIINTSSSIDHDNLISDFSSIAPGVTLGGEVFVGKFSAISLGAKIIHSIKIGKETVIGAGAVVVKDIPDNVVAYGVPAKIIRKRAISDRYL